MPKKSEESDEPKVMRTFFFLASEDKYLADAAHINKSNKTEVLRAALKEYMKKHPVERPRKATQ